MRRAYVHAGLAKTGTTSIQAFLSQSQEQLAGLGFDYPSVGFDSDRMAHHNLTYELLGNARFDPALGTVSEILDYAVAAELKKRNLILSSERFLTCITSNVAFDGFAQMIDGLHARSYRVLVPIMFRRFDRFLESSYLEALKSGTLTVQFGTYLAARKKWFGSLFRGLDRLSSKIGKDYLLLHVLESGRGDAVHDFMDLLELDRLKFPLRSFRDNMRLGLKKAAFLYQFQFDQTGEPRHRLAEEVRQLADQLLHSPDLPGEIFTYSLLSPRDTDDILNDTYAELKKYPMLLRQIGQAAQQKSSTEVLLANVSLSKTDLEFLQSVSAHDLPLRFSSG